MKPSEIIAEDVRRNGRDPQAVLATVAYYLHNKVAQLMQRGDTVLMVRPISEKYADLHLFSTDKPQNILRALPFFIEAIRRTKLKRVYGNATEPGTTEMLRRAGVEILPSDLPDYNWMANV